MATKTVNTMAEALEYMQKMATFMRVHNELCKDFSVLEKTTVDSINGGNPSPELIRACIKELFSLMEADIFLMNVYQPYHNYNDRKHDFLRKFKKTYRYHCTFHKTMNIYNDFIKSSYSQLIKLKNKRDAITHPKSKEDIAVGDDIFNEAYEYFRKYSKFVSTVNTDVWVGTKLKMPFGL